ncbi:drug/metabolite-transporting permease [Paraflavitalea soli]|uniref:Drug/metabolite-transporting permease n=1 Tax=Paraflavitalea soli TaxID=2315862 RepID=A0A3B7MTK1_9BACT|nr:EamA family transporter [Paraflavitalea soli]AXY76296.1 drug/metabolite-transporting permease [Paraflavitalea soli]
MTAPTNKAPFLQQRGTRFKALFALGMVCFFWGTTWIASRQGVKHMPALQLAGIRQSIGGLLYVIFFLSKGRAWPRGKEWGPIIILSLLNFALSNGLSTWGVKYISAGLGSIIAATFPLWIVIINLVTAKSKIPAKAVIGLLLGFTGVCVIFYEHLADFLDPEFRFGILLSLTASWTWAFGTLYTKQQAAAFNPYFSLGLQMLISGILTTIIAVAAGQTIPVQDIPWQSWTAIAYLATFGSVISFIAYLYALQNLPTEQASIYAYINPVVAVLLGSLLFNEKLTLFIIAGGAITLLGVHLINQAYRRNKGVRN